MTDLDSRPMTERQVGTHRAGDGIAATRAHFHNAVRLPPALTIGRADSRGWR